MTKLKYGIPGLVVLLAGGIQAQDISGIWQGSLRVPNQEIRIVFEVQKTGQDSLGGVFHIIDRGGQVAVNRLELDGSTVRMGLPVMNGRFEGALSADGDAINGFFKQGPGSVPLNFVRPTPETAWEIPRPAVPTPMDPDEDPEFAVATIKPNTSSSTDTRLQPGRQLRATNITVKEFLKFAYNVHDRQIQGGPGWMDTDRYDIVAQTDVDGEPSVRQVRVMMQKLLRDRFGLTLHTEEREMPVYTIQVDEGGPAMATADPDGPGDPDFNGIGSLQSKSMNMDDLAETFQALVLDRPVLNRTGLDGRYVFSLVWAPDEFQFPSVSQRLPARVAAERDDLFTAMWKQLGLRLEAAEAPVEVLVIDSIDRPSEN